MLLVTQSSNTLMGSKKKAEINKEMKQTGIYAVTTPFKTHTPRAVNKLYELEARIKIQSKTVMMFKHVDDIAQMAENTEALKEAPSQK